MGYFSDIITTKLAKTTCRNIYEKYLRLINAPGLNEIEILRWLINNRGPFWEIRENFAFFKGCQAFVINESINIFILIILVNIWELIIATPDKVQDKSYSIKDLRSAIFIIVAEATRIRENLDSSMRVFIRYGEEINENTKIIYDWTAAFIKKLGGIII